MGGLATPFVFGLSHQNVFEHLLWLQVFSRFTPVFVWCVRNRLSKSYRSVRGNAHPVCLFNARVASSWKLRNLVLVWRITRRKSSGPCQGSK